MISILLNVGFECELMKPNTVIDPVLYFLS